MEGTDNVHVAEESVLDVFLAAESERKSFDGLCALFWAEFHSRNHPPANPELLPSHHARALPGPAVPRAPTGRQHRDTEWKRGGEKNPTPKQHDRIAHAPFSVSFCSLRMLEPWVQYRARPAGGTTCAPPPALSPRKSLWKREIWGIKEGNTAPG